MRPGRAVALAMGPAAAAVVGVACLLGGLPAPAAWCAAVTAWCAVWWIAEPIPIPATSILPFAIFPLVGVMSGKEVAVALGDDIILLFMGGFMLSVALEKAGAHRRLALGMVRAVGGRGGRRLVLGFMLAGAILSMWISNTATALMLLPVAAAVLQQARDPRLTAPLLLGVAYATSIGGIGTPIGTPPNLVFIKNYELATRTADAPGVQIDFVTWMSIGIPVVAVCLPLAWLYLTRKLTGPAERVELPPLGPWRSEEVRVMAVFTVTAILWITRVTPYGGWTRLITMLGESLSEAGATPLISGAGVTDATVALLAVLVMFLVPSGRGGRDSLLDWQTASKIPWGILLLFAGGIAIARGFEQTGLSVILGQSLQGLSEWNLLLMIGGICLTVTFLTEVTSNTATTNLLMPVLAAAGIAAKIDPVYFMVPAAISASCAFMLPVATPPNAIVYATGEFKLRDMAREGLALNFICAVIVTLMCWLLLRPWSAIE